MCESCSQFIGGEGADFIDGYACDDCRDSYGAESIGTKGLGTVWWAYKMDDVDWQDYLQYKKNTKHMKWGELESFMEWRHDKEWEDDEDIHYDLRFFKSKDAAKRFIGGRSKVIYADQYYGPDYDPSEDELIRVYGQLDIEAIVDALQYWGTQIGKNTDCLTAPLLFEGKVSKEAESFAAPLTFNQWSDDEKHESSHQGGDTYFEDWLDEELHSHGKGISLKRWGDEEESESEHQHAESSQTKPYSPILIGAFIGLGTGLWAMKQIHDRKDA